MDGHQDTADGFEVQLFAKGNRVPNQPQNLFPDGQKRQSLPKFNVECSGCHLGVTARAEGQTNPKSEVLNPFGRKAEAQGSWGIFISV